MPTGNEFLSSVGGDACGDLGTSMQEVGHFVGSSSSSSHTDNLRAAATVGKDRIEFPDEAEFSALFKERDLFKNSPLILCSPPL